ncbi:hypothetical protein IQ07DRAFT_586154 [Pyrenochaeta sp. DS3sAY3a]|nr:hypothetical protein IQ07DRAFT_586154 [Pyrenochaeta sp. DS3sAY3a]
MPSFTFWKSSKEDESRSPLLSDDATTNMVKLPASRNIDLNPGNQDSGVFLFEDEDLPPHSPGPSRSQSGRTVAPKDDFVKEIEQQGESNTTAFVQNATVRSPLLAREEENDEPPATMQEPTHLLSSERLPPPEHQPTEAESLCEKLVKHEDLTLSSRDRDSGVYLSDDERNVSETRPTSVVMSDEPLPSRTTSLSSKLAPSFKSATTPQRTESNARRLRRPAELNLSSTAATKPRTELEMRYDMMRNSKTQSKAALRSPTELLRERLNMSPKKKRHEEKVHVFTPPKATLNGCLMPGPGTQTDAFVSTSVRARTEAGGKPAWWCKFDKLVVFDGVEVQDDGELKIHTRTSKGLSIARRRGDMETIVIPMDCAHCQEMLNRHEWKYDMQVCKRSVCWDCKARCSWELEQERRSGEQQDDRASSRTDASRYRADSVLQDDHVQEEDLMRKVVIEQGLPKSPIEAVGGIEERLKTQA